MAGSREEIYRIFEKWCEKLRLKNSWDVKLEFGENRNLSYGRCEKQKSFNELYDGLKNLE